MTRSIIICFCSRLTFDVIVADSLSSDELDDKINIEHVFEANLLLIRAYYTHVTELISFMFIAFNRACSVHAVEISEFNF